MVGIGLAMSSVPNARSADNHQFGRLHQHRQMAMLHQVSANDGSDYDYNPNDCEHAPLT